MSNGGSPKAHPRFYLQVPGAIVLKLAHERGRILVSISFARIRYTLINWRLFFGTLIIGEVILCGTVSVYYLIVTS